MIGFYEEYSSVAKYDDDGNMISLSEGSGEYYGYLENVNSSIDIYFTQASLLNLIRRSNEFKSADKCSVVAKTSKYKAATNTLYQERN